MYPAGRMVAASIPERAAARAERAEEIDSREHGGAFRSQVQPRVGRHARRELHRCTVGDCSSDGVIERKRVETESRQCTLDHDRVAERPLEERCQCGTRDRQVSVRGNQLFLQVGDVNVRRKSIGFNEQPLIEPVPGCLGVRLRHASDVHRDSQPLLGDGDA